jgi:CheY-like chemotaxis protein
MDHPRLRLLVADDDELLRETLAEVLASDGHEVAQAADGQQALEHLRLNGNCTCAVLLDWVMPVADGEAFLTARAASSALSRIPVFVVSATHRPVDDDRVQGFLEKPFTLDDLLVMLRGVCGAHCAERSCPLAPDRRSVGG